MNTTDVIVLAVIIGIFALCSLFVYKSKKKGKKCIGCPDSCACSGGNCSSGCHGQCGEK